MSGFWQGASSGAITGAIGGGLGAGVNLLSNASGSWSGVVQALGRSTVSGISSNMSGGSFEKGFTTGLALAGAAAAYKAYVGYGIDPKSGGESVIKYGPEDGGRDAVGRANNVGIARLLSPTGTVESYSSDWSFEEGNKLSSMANQIPTVNSMAGLHDTFMGTVESVIGKNLVSNIINPLTIFPAMAVNTVATLSLMPEASGYLASHARY